MPQPASTTFRSSEVASGRDAIPAAPRPSRGLRLPPDHHAALRRAVGNRALASLVLPAPVQVPGRVAPANDPFERAADAAADRLVGGHQYQPGRRPVPAPPDRAVVLGEGQPLDQDARARFEDEFAMDFSGVRIHADGSAAKAAGQLASAAFTVGNHIVFGEGRYMPGTARGSWLLAHELTHVAQQAPGTTGVVRRVPLPDYSQAGDTCDPASLMTSLILWDTENKGAGTVNPNIVGICNAALLYMNGGPNKLGGVYLRPGGGALLQFNRQYLGATRDRLRVRGTTATQKEYQMVSTILATFGRDVGEIMRKLNLEGPASVMANSLAGIFADPLLTGLNPGESVQVNWLTRVRQQDVSGKPLGTAAGYHAFAVGRSKDGTWFLSDQGKVPPLHLEAASLDELRSGLSRAAQRGESGLVTDPGQKNTDLGWTGVRKIRSQDYARVFRALVRPGTFLAEVDAGLRRIGERVFAWDYVGTGYDQQEIEALFRSSGVGHGFLVGENPAGVFSVFKTNPVGAANAGVNDIDSADSTGGLLLDRSVFVHTWLKPRTSTDSSTVGRGFQVY
jgi:hypothetical protein